METSGAADVRIQVSDLCLSCLKHVGANRSIVFEAKDLRLPSFS